MKPTKTHQPKEAGKKGKKSNENFWIFYKDCQNLKEITYKSHKEQELPRAVARVRGERHDRKWKQYVIFINTPNKVSSWQAQDNVLSVWN